jgi:hypothetical protein
MLNCKYSHLVSYKTAANIYETPGAHLVSMRTLAPLLAFAAVPLGVLAAAARVPTLKEAVITPHGWTRRARAPAEHKINLRIGLPQGDFPALERHLYEVSDRTSSSSACSEHL